ncbi:MAG: MATE family efflux transporter [Cellulosilyticaceae bacterium]
MQSNAMLMTEGSIYKKIITFAIPIFFGNLFQQLYNIVDSLIVGNFLGKESLAAISSTGSLIFLLVGLVGGVFSGAGVVISRYFGAEDIKNVQKAIHTAICFALIAGISLTIIGTILSPQILKWMGTPESVFPNAVKYVRIYFSGILTIVMYNAASGIFQAIGDSKRPLYFLIVSSITNVILDLLFVVVFKMGIGGAALATVIAQAVSAILAFRHLMRTQDVYKVSFKKLAVHFDMLKQILQMGIPSGVQNSVIALANIVVQSNINSFDAVAVAGCGSYSKIEGFVFIPITSFAMSMTVFIGQNLGAGKFERAKKGTYFGIGVSTLLAETIGILFFINAPHLIALFNRDPEVIAYGTLQARTIALFFFLLAFSHCVAGILRGAGKSIVPMLVMLVCWCVIRVLYVTIATSIVHDIQVIFWAYPLTWSLSSCFFLIYYLKGNWMHTFKKHESDNEEAQALN